MMNTPDEFIQRIQVAHRIGRGIVKAYDNPNMISEAIGLIASELEYQGVGIGFFNHADRVTSVFTADFGKSFQTTHKQFRFRNGWRYCPLGNRTRGFNR
jgi:hypothetical protein